MFLHPAGNTAEPIIEFVALIIYLDKVTLRKGYFFTLFIILLMQYCAMAQSRQYRFKYLTVDEGLSHTDANDIAQDKQGYIWIATFFGLDRFDGYTVKQFYNTNLPIRNAFRNRLYCLYPDDEGNIWLNSEDGIQCFDVKKQRYTDYSVVGGSNHTGIGAIAKPPGNIIYALSGNILGKYLIKGDKLYPQVLPLPAGLRLTKMFRGKDNTLYFSTNNGIWLLDAHSHFIKLQIAGFNDTTTGAIFIDKYNNLLFSAGNKLYMARPNAAGQSSLKQLKIVKQFTGPADMKVYGMSEYNSEYWLNTGAVLLKLNNDLQLVQQVNSEMQSGLNSNSLRTIFVDRSACLWVCTFGGGVNYCDLNQKQFYTLQHQPGVVNSLSGNYIRSVLEDGNNLWIGTNANGLNLYDQNTHQFTLYSMDQGPVKLKSNTVSALTFDNQHNLWIGSSAGIDVLQAGRNNLLKLKGSEGFPRNSIETLTKDYYGNIWFGNHTDRFGVICKSPSGDYRVKYYGEGFFIFADEDKPQLFVSSTRGLSRILVDQQGNINQIYEYTGSGGNNTLSSSYTYPVCRQNDTTYWIGTIGGGLDKLVLHHGTDTYTVNSYKKDKGVFNDVESLEIDDAGNIWLGGNGLECLNPNTGALIRYDKNDGLQGNSFKVGASYKGRAGRLYFGGINGLNYFKPAEIKTNPIAATPVLTDILINYNHYAGNENNRVADTSMFAIGYDRLLKLNYRQNNFVISFSAMHFANPLKCKFRYRLIGFDRGWRYTDGKNPEAAYSNLDYKDYKFIVQATNNDNVWSSATASVKIDIIPPWWRLSFAIAVYILLALLVLIAIYVYQARWYRLKREMAINAVNEKKREEMHRQQEEIYEQQLVFFTNVSHEFKTPLTLILGPLEGLMRQNENSLLNYSYQLMYKNATRLLNLIGELMNFKKVADSIIKLHVQPLQIPEFCNEIAQGFTELADAKDITFKVSTGKAVESGWFDRRLLEKILYNLLSNAFKYTEPTGQVQLEVFTNMAKFKPAYSTGFSILNEHNDGVNYVYFRVADSGIGISADSIKNIFDRYYRVSKHHLGSGIGLALVKSLTQLHHGNIYVYSERGKGTEIIIGIPYDAKAYSEAERTQPNDETGDQLETIDYSIAIPSGNPAAQNEPLEETADKHILLVEDNDELRAFLKQALLKKYEVHEAKNGREGVDLAIEINPDLIISDLMMPLMDGSEFCRIVKEQFETRHIPFIMLSAKDALDSKIAGIESGADYYFSKPLSMNMLMLTISNIFEQTEKLKQRYTSDYLSRATELVHTEQDKQFFDNMLMLIEENIHNPDLDVDFLCKHLFISRTKLYQKIKGIADQSVAEFIRAIRLKKAIHIMTHEDVSMNEIADRIGLQSSSNFSRAFKKVYGKSPLQFLQNLKG